MNGEHKRIVELAAGWEGSDAYVSLSPADALLLKSVGAPVEAGEQPAHPARIRGKALTEAARKLQASDVETPAGAEPTPNQQSVSPGTDPAPARVAVAGEPTQPGTVDLNPGGEGLPPAGGLVLDTGDKGRRADTKRK